VAVPSLRHSVVVRGDRPDGDGESPLEAMYAEGDLERLDSELGAPASADDPCLIVYTSGTTSRPKGCLHTFNTIHASATAMVARLGIDDSDVFFNPSPVAHSTGLVTGLLMPILAGAGTHFQPSWDAADGLRRIAEYHCTVTYTATTFISTVMQAYVEGEHDMSSMRYWVCAGAPIPGAIVQAARSLFPRCSVLSLYGRSENMTTTMCGPDDAPERSVTSDGHALPSAEVVVVDGDGTRLPAGQEGDVAYHGPSHMLEYYRDAEQTAELYTADGFSRSGDLGVQDEQGFVRVSGRLKDIIIRGGLNISSREVEDLLSAHPAIRSVAVVAMPDARLGEKSCAFVVLAPDTGQLTLGELNTYLQSHKIAVQKLPERLEIIEALPMTAVGKVRKNVLRDQIAATLAAEANAPVSS
jgi:cyclohexanecarboxylate-CoA ligase